MSGIRVTDGNPATTCFFSRALLRVEHPSSPNVLRLSSGTPARVAAGHTATVLRCVFPPIADGRGHPPALPVVRPRMTGLPTLYFASPLPVYRGSSLALSRDHARPRCLARFTSYFSGPPTCCIVVAEHAPAAALVQQTPEEYAKQLRASGYVSTTSKHPYRIIPRNVKCKFS